MHLSEDFLVKLMDDELSPSEVINARAHLAACDECSRAQKELQNLSGDIEALVSASSAAMPDRDRGRLVRAIETREVAAQVVARSQNPATIFRRFGWGMGLAAMLALGIMLAPRTKERIIAETPPMAEQTTTLEVDGENFIPLPYSNPDLPISSSRIVQMQVPVSSLTAAGIVFEPVSIGASSADRTVLADLLIGTDGQPLGVHILGVE